MLEEYGDCTSAVQEALRRIFDRSGGKSYLQMCAERAEGEDNGHDAVAELILMTTLDVLKEEQQ